MARIFVSQPCSNGHVHQKTIITGQTISYDHEPHFKYIENCSLVTKARQDHFGMFLQQKQYDYLLSFDADMVVGPPGCVDRMIERLPPNSIMGGLYAMKALKPDGLAPMNGMTLDKKEPDLDGQLVKMRYLPTGFMLIPRKVAVKMAEAYKDLKYTDQFIGKTWAVYNTMLIDDDEGVRRFLPEDFSFCTRATAIGIDIWADTSVMIGHIGPYLYHVEHLRKESTK